MSDELALLTAIIAYPDEDTPRLVFADWLDENGQPERAEFIRVQMELARLPDHKHQTPRYRGLLIRFRELIAGYRDGWVKALGVPPTRAIFRRGFVEELRVTAIELLNVSDAVLARELLSTVTIMPPADEELVGFTGAPGDAALRRLAEWPGRGRLRTVCVERMPLSPPAVEAFVNAPSAAGLRTLDVVGSVITGDVVRVLAASANLTELTELRLGTRQLDAGDVLALARAPHLKKLQTILLRVAGEDDPDSPEELRAAGRELRARYPHVHWW
jgi:uncharacterized protein (TIGR02996 family)